MWWVAFGKGRADMLESPIRARTGQNEDSREKKRKDVKAARARRQRAINTSHRQSGEDRVGMRETALLADCLSQPVGVRLPCDSGNAE